MIGAPRFDLEHTLAALARHPEVEVVGRAPRVRWWDAQDFAEILAELRASAAPLERAVLAALGPRPAAWLELPAFVALQWEADLDAHHDHPVGRLGGLCMSSPLDAWILRDDPSWRAPWTPSGADSALLLDIDDYHGNGNFTVAALVGDRLQLAYSDGHVFFPLAVDPLRLFQVGLEALGWPHWPLLFSGRRDGDDPRRHEADYLGPMCAALGRWLPDTPRPALRAALAEWRARNPDR